MGVLLFQHKTFMEERFPFKFHFGGYRKVKQDVHMHDYVQLVYVMRGSCSHFFCDRELVMSKGDLFMIPPWVEHSVNTDGHDADIVLIDFLPVLVNDKLAGFSQTVLDRLNGGRLASRAEDRSVNETPLEGKTANLRDTWLHFPQEKQQLVEQLLLDIADELKRKESGYEFSIQLSLVKLLQLMDRELGKQERNFREGRANRLKQTQFDQVMKYIAENYMKDITLEQGAELANMAPAYFSHQFKRATGTAFIDCLHETRIERAKELITLEKLTMTDICYEVGFHHLSHFIRTFKKKTGLTPTAYKKALLYAPDPETTPFC
ncbi:AraC family transcriptional regulator [Paenibacillus sp. MBLB4367]|uniref:helix-turn-helix domain-containing protein n=1 Tax=Paenibacillus sp. MBLB4367 TaxID=3384767 RepID=UPI0039082847